VVSPASTFITSSGDDLDLASYLRIEEREHGRAELAEAKKEGPPDDGPSVTR
jgi:hypothetical protein